MRDAKEVVSIFRNLADRHGVARANMYLLAYVQVLVHECEAGVLDPRRLQEFATRLRDELLEVADQVNPFISAILGVLEEGVNSSSLSEAVDRIKRLWSEGRLDRLEV